MIPLSIWLALSGAASLQPAPGAVQVQPPTLKLRPEVVRMGAFYAGEWMRISGTVAPGSKAIVVIRGPDTEEVFNRKGRAGPIWINTGKLHIAGVPTLFLCYSSEPLEKLLTREEIEKNQLDASAIERQMTITPKEMDEKIIRENFVSLKLEERVYRMISDEMKEGEGTYALDFHWPRKAAPDRYSVAVYECRNGAIVGKAAATLEVVEIGFPATMAWLAAQHESLYGLVAVLVAILVGFGMDFLVAGLRRKLGRKAGPGAPQPAPEPSKTVGKGVGTH